MNTSESLYLQAFKRLLKNKAAVASLCVLVAMSLTVILGPLVIPFSFDETNFAAIHLPPLTEGHILGTDDLGRDLLVRCLVGGQLSLSIGLVAALVSLSIGVCYGMVAGYFGGKTDAVMMRVVDILYAIPFMFVVILLMVLFGRHIFLIFMAIGAINWLNMARIVRGQTLHIKEQLFIEAAQSFGLQKRTMMFRHILPNLFGIIIVYITLTIPQLILAESFLSFLGLGVQEPYTSWGALVKTGADEMEYSPWTLAFPALFLSLTLFCFNFIGDGLRDALDPKDKR